MQLRRFKKPDCVFHIWGYKATPIEVDRTKAAEQSWVTRKQKHGVLGMKKVLQSRERVTGSRLQESHFVTTKEGNVLRFTRKEGSP